MTERDADELACRLDASRARGTTLATVCALAADRPPGTLREETRLTIVIGFGIGDPEPHAGQPRRQMESSSAAFVERLERERVGPVVEWMAALRGTMDA